MNLTWRWDYHKKAYIIGIAGMVVSDIQYVYTKKAFKKIIAELEEKYGVKAVKSEYKHKCVSRIGEKYGEPGMAYKIFYDDGLYYLVNREGYIISEDTAWSRIKERVYERAKA